MSSPAQLFQLQHDAANAANGTNGNTPHPEVQSEDPYPAFVNSSSLNSSLPIATTFDSSDASAFPSLGGPAKAAVSWGAGLKIKPTVASSPRPSTPDDRNLYTESLSLNASDISQALASKSFLDNLGSNRRQPEPRTLGEVMKLLMKNHNIKIEASTSRNITTFIIKGTGATAQQEVAAGKRELMGRLSKKINIDVMIPASLRAFIIGAKGKTLKQITESTGAAVQVPPRDANESPIDDDSEGPLIPISISGPASACAEAKAQILAIVSERAAKLVVKLDSIPSSFWPFISGFHADRIPALVEAVDAKDVTIESRGGEKLVITITGGREAVGRVVTKIHLVYVELQQSLQTISTVVKRNQQRFLTGAAADQLLVECGCTIELPAADSGSDQVTLRGPEESLAKGFSFVLAKAKATPVESLDLSGAHGGNKDVKSYSTNLTRYLIKKSKFKKLSDSNSVEVYLPSAAAIAAGKPEIDIVGKDLTSIAGAKTDIIAIVRTLPPANFAIVQVDNLLHRFLAKNGSKINSVADKASVDVLFPPEGEDRSDILLVFTGENDAIAALSLVREGILSVAKGAADIKTVTILIPQQHHSSITGKNGTTLNAIIGEEKLVNVSFGGASEDTVVIRGSAPEVARVQAAVEQAVEDAKNFVVANSYVVEFEIETSAVRHIVGKGGAVVNKLRDDLGVKIDFVELPVSESKGNKTSIAKSKVTIKGRKENVEETKKRILSQGEKIADETTLVIPLPASFERGSLIGKQGMYLKRLETNYSVRINFPKDKKNENGQVDEITIRGSKKGAEAAKKELVDLMEYEKENGQVLTFTVSSKALPRVLGKAGASINAIKDETNVQIDIDQSDATLPTASVTLKGTKTGTQKAKLMILAIAKEVDDETILSITIPRVYHMTLIGAGGANIRDLITRCGGPADARASGNTVRFPKQGDVADVVSIRAPKTLAEKIQKALEKEVSALQSRIVYGVVVPHGLHAGIIGKGASALQELQRKFAVKLIFPGWNEYESSGEVVNPDDVKAGNAKDIIKILGAKEAALATAAEILKGRPNTSSVTTTITVPRNLHSKLAQGGRFFRSLPNQTRITHGSIKPPTTKLPKQPASAAASTPSASARIDDDSEQIEEEILVQVVALASDTAEGGEDIPWIIEAASQEDLDRTVATINKLLKESVAPSHVAYLTVPRSLMPRIVGRGGSGLEKIRSHGVEIEVVGKKDANQLTVVGTNEAIDEAISIIRQLNAPRYQN